MAAPDWKILTPLRDRLGENPMWHASENAFYWSDWFGPTIHRLAWGQDKVESWSFPGETVLGSFVFARGGRLLVAVDSGLKLFDPATGALTPFADPNGRREGLVYNDGKLDRFGRLWIGTYELAEVEPRGILYCVMPDGAWHVADSGYASCNGPAFSSDGATMYFSDSVGRRIMAYDISPDTPRLSNRRVFAQIENGLPDGLTVDAEGCLWCAQYGGAAVTRFRPDGTVDRVLELPCPITASVAFGGPELTTLFVATGFSLGVERAEDETGPGGLMFTLETEIKGLPELVFAA